MNVPIALKSASVPSVISAPAQSFSVVTLGLQLSDLETAQSLLPLELASAVDKRKIDFITGRICADRALVALDGRRSWGTVALGPDRIPLWPEGVVGSITHTEGFTSACVGLTTDYESIGVDAEKIMPLTQAEKIKETISSPSERDLIKSNGLALGEGLSLIFSAKESLFKCLHPLVKINFGFLDAELKSLDPARGFFSIQLLRELTKRFPVGTEFDGNFAWSGDLIVTGVAVHCKRKYTPRVFAVTRSPTS